MIVIVLDKEPCRGTKERRHPDAKSSTRPEHSISALVVIKTPNTHQEIKVNERSRLSHIRRKSHPFCCITSRQWTFWFLGTVVEEAELRAPVPVAVPIIAAVDAMGVEIEPPGLPAVTGVASHTPAEIAMSSFLLQTSCNRRTMRPKDP